MNAYQGTGTPHIFPYRLGSPSRLAFCLRLTSATIIPSSSKLERSSSETFGISLVVSSGPSSTEVLVAVNGNYASGGTVTITVSGGKNVATFNNVTCSSYTLTGSFTCP